MDGSQDFTASRLSFEVSGEGVAVDPATGRLSIDTDRLAAGVAVTVTATNALGGTVSRLRLTLATEAQSAPVLVTAPALAPVATVAMPVVLDPGTWDGVPAPDLAVAWLLDGAVVDGATGPSYTPAAADAGKALAARVTATNAAGTAAAETAARAVVHAAPTVVAALAAVAVDAGSAPVAVAAAAAFAGLALTFAVSGRGATIDSATGVVTIATDQLLDGETITVTATNSGGSAQAAFPATVRATLPGSATPPALAGTGVVGTPVTLDPGTWTGMPAPDLAVAWLLDGAIVAGATGPSYTPAAADDGKRLAARVTARNAAGQAEAETATLAVVHAAPAVIGALADVALFVGDAAAVVDAAAAFAGSALVFTVAGGGATVDAKGRVSVPATAAGSAKVTVTATNSGGAASVSFTATVSVKIVLPVLVVAPVLAGTGRIGTPVTVSAGTWSGVPTPATSVEWLRNGAVIAGATGSSYTPVAADDGKALSARVKATNIGGSAETVTAALAVTYAPPVAKGGLVEEIFDLGSGVQTVAAGPDFTGENLAFAVSGAGATIDAKTGLVSIPTAAAVQATVTVTATNSGGSATSSFAVTVEAEDVPFALEADDVTIATAVWRPEAQATWLTPVVRFPGLEAETVHAIEWTTGKDPVSDAQFEVATKVETDRYQLYMRDAAKNLPGATPRVDYSVWRLDETDRRQALRFRWRRTAQGPWSGLSPAYSVPEVPKVPETTVYPFMGRTAQQYAAGVIGGTGKQNFKHVARTAANPALIWWGLDVNGPVASKDAGGWYYSPPLKGMSIQESSAGIWIDPADADRILNGVSGGDLRSTSTTPNAYDLKAGLYLSTDGGKTATFVLQLDNVPSCGVNTERDNRQLFVGLPGGTPTTRTVYYVHKPRPKGGAWLDGTLYRSTDGGATWKAYGAGLTNATFGSKIFWIDADPSGNLYIGADNGLFKSANGGTNWTACTGIAGPVIIVNAYHGGTDVWAARDGNGAYKATNAAGTAFSRNPALGAYDIVALAVCPADATRILVAEGAAGTDGKWSHDGGASWSGIVNRSYDGATDDWPSKMCGEVAIFSWTPGSKTEVIVQRKQHFGKSTDGGKTTGWSANGTDYQTRRGMGFNLDDWQEMISGTQDTGAIYTNDGQRTEIECNFAATQTTALRDSSSYTTGSGGVFLKNGAHKAIITAAGGTPGQRTPVVWTISGTAGSAALLDPSVRGGHDYSGHDLTDRSVGWSGNCRYKLSSGGAVSLDKANMAQEFFGVSATSMRIFGGAKGGSGKDLYVSANGGDGWSPWATSPVRYRTLAGYSYAVEVSRFSANRVYVGEASGGTGRVYRMEGASPTETLVFTLADWPGFNAPETVVHRVRECPSDPTILYVLAFAAGNSYVFRISDALTSPSVEDITANAPLRAISWMYVHPLTDDVILGGQVGSRIIRCHPGSKAPNAGALYDRTKGFVAANLAAGAVF